ncbi:MAG: GNAT family N-acetyltransferase [Candidatus Rokuibacteriota bacterium]
MAPATELQQEVSVSPRVVAHGERVWLRLLEPSDRSALRRWANDAFLERMAGSEFLRAYRRAEAPPSFLDACLADPTQVIFIVTAAEEDGEPLGLVRLFNIHRRESYAFLETIIADRKALGKGCGVEAGKLICAWGLDVLTLERIEAKVYEYNALSINALKRNGFQQEGVLRKAGYQAGRRCDVLIFGILREELEARRQQEAHPERFCFA